MFQQLPINGNRQQQSYELISQNKAMDSEYMPFLYNNLYSVTKSFISGGTNYVALAIGIICIAGLLLPTQGEQNQKLPDYLHLSVNFKLIFAFVLGKVWSEYIGR